MSLTTATFLPFHRALIEDEEVAAVLDVLQSGWLTTGPRVREFEAAFAQYTGARHAIAVNSCTAALHLALAAIDVGPGDEVIVPTMTFASSGNAVQYLNARPVLVDCAPKSFHVDPEQISKAITSRTKAILPVHYAGYACDMDAIKAIALAHNLKIIEDAAHALPTRYNDKMVGTIGDITCFSFYATKTMTTGEGGMLTTDDAAFAERMRILSLHGISKDAWKRYAADGSWRYDIQEMGFKYNMTDLAASIGLVQLTKCDAMCARRRRLAERYSKALAHLEAYETPSTPMDAQHAWHLYVLQINTAALVVDRNRVIEELKSRGIGTSVHFIPLHLHTLYQERFGYRFGDFPNAEERFESAVSLPIYPSMTDEDSDRVIEALHDIARVYRI